MNTEKPKKRRRVYALVIAPHPDDVDFGIAGTVARWTREGKRVVYVICTSGDKGTNDPNMKPETLVKLREKEQTAAARVVGVKEVVFLHYPDQGIEDSAELRKEIVKQIRIFRPEAVASTDPYRKYIWHRDHRLTGQVVLDAVYPYARDRLAYPDLYEQGYLPHKVKEVWFWGTSEPNLTIDITDVFELKLKALRCHKSQFDFAQMEKRMRERYSEIGKKICTEYAETFHREELGR